MKKLLFCIVLVSLLLMLVACKGTQGNGGDTQGTQEYKTEQNDVGETDSSESSGETVSEAITSEEATSSEEATTVEEATTSENVTEATTSNPGGVIDLPIIPF